jgi:hypothetical protein
VFIRTCTRDHIALDKLDNCNIIKESDFESCDVLTWGTKWPSSFEALEVSCKWFGNMIMYPVQDTKFLMSKSLLPYNKWLESIRYVGNGYLTSKADIPVILFNLAIRPCVTVIR